MFRQNTNIKSKELIRRLSQKIFVYPCALVVMTLISFNKQKNQLPQSHKDAKYHQDKAMLRQPPGMS